MEEWKATATASGPRIGEGLPIVTLAPRREQFVTVQYICRHNHGRQWPMFGSSVPARPRPGKSTAKAGYDRTLGHCLGAGKGAPLAGTPEQGAPEEPTSGAFDSKIEASSAKMYFHYYGQLLHQQNMLQDYVRTGVPWKPCTAQYGTVQVTVLVHYCLMLVPILMLPWLLRMAPSSERAPVQD